MYKRLFINFGKIIFFKIYNSFFRMNWKLDNGENRITIIVNLQNNN